MITIFKNIITVSEPHYISVQEALNRIRIGKSKNLCEQIRACKSKDERNNLKKQLPCVVFTGKFEKRHNNGCIEQSKLIILDFDYISNLPAQKELLKNTKFIYAFWVSPSGEGIKALVKVSTNNHEKHFLALEKHFNNLDKAGKDLSRVCYESYDPDVYVNEDAETFSELFVEIKKEIKIDTTTSDYKFSCLLKWIQDKGTSFVEKNRNNFTFKLACACNRIGMDVNDALYNILNVVSGSGFEDEATSIIKGTYKRYAASFGKYEMEENQVFSKDTRENKTESVFDGDDFSDDLITFNSVWGEFMNTYKNGITKGDSTHIPEIDPHFRWMKGQTNLLQGYGNFGKSTFFGQIALLKSLYDGTKHCYFSPEQMPAVFFYRDLIQALIGKSLNTSLQRHITEEEINNIKDFVNDHFLIIYPKKNKATPEYVLDRFFECVIKNNIDSCIIDPFNKLSHNWGARDDHYLEEKLTTFKTFATQNDVYFSVMAHPKNPPRPDKTEDMPTPDVWDLAGGAMWNNSMDNILCYHRPKHHVDKSSSECLFASQKIRFQQMNGIQGTIYMRYDRENFRFYFNNKSPFETDFVRNKLNIKNDMALQPNTSFFSNPDSRIQSERETDEQIPF